MSVIPGKLARGLVPGGTLQALAPGAFVLLWSSGFVGSKLGFPYAEPLTFLKWRFLITLALLIPYAAITRAAWPRDPRGTLHAAVTGLLLHAVYLTGTWYAIHLGLPTGLAALIVGLQPILTAVCAPMLGERVARRAWLGLTLGFLGVVLVVGDKLLHAGSLNAPALAFVMIGLALFGTTGGTLYQRQFGRGVPLVTGTVIQYVAALAFVWPAAAVFETGVVHWTPQFILAMAWLVLGLSLGAIFLLLWLLARRGTTSVTGLFYLVPPLAAIEAYFLFHETFGVTALIGMLIAAGGVALVLTPGHGTHNQKEGAA